MKNKVIEINLEPEELESCLSMLPDDVRINVKGIEGENVKKELKMTVVAQDPKKLLYDKQ